MTVIYAECSDFTRKLFSSGDFEGISFEKKESEHMYVC